MRSELMFAAYQRRELRLSLIPEKGYVVQLGAAIYLYTQYANYTL